MKLFAYAIVDRAIREGITLGLTKAMLSDDIKSNPELLVNYVADWTMNELQTVILFEDMSQEEVKLNPAIEDEEKAQTEENKTNENNTEQY